MLKITKRTFPLETEGQINRMNSELTQYERTFAEIAEEPTATKCHAIGEYITVHGVFCEVIAPISVGETITFDSKVKAVSIGSVLAEQGE